MSGPTIGSRMVPPAPFGPALLVRAGVLWMLLRVILLQMLPALEAEPLPVSVFAASSIVFATIVLGALDVTRRAEWVPLANLGFGRAATLVPLAGAPVVLELLLFAIVR